MSRKSKIVLAITLMVAVMVSAFSYLYVSQVVRQRLNSAFETATLLDSQLGFAANEAVPELADTRVDTNNPVAVRKATADYLQQDASLNSVVDSIVWNWSIVYDAAVVDTDGRVVGVMFAYDISRDSTAYALTRTELDAVLGPVLAGNAPTSVGTGDCLSE